MNWQEISVGIILVIAVYFLYKKFNKKEDNCGENDCGCS
jgi:hypothetical protein